jgi:hypothetical protein
MRFGRLARAFMMLALAAMLSSTALTSAQAADPAGRYDGWYPSGVSGCDRNYRVGAVTSIYQRGGTYYGWAEQRWSYSGACWGYQWIRLHVTEPIPIRAEQSEIPGHLSTRLHDERAGRWTTTWEMHWEVAVGIHDQQLLFAPNDSLCGDIWVEPELVGGGNLTFGHRGVYSKFCT